MVQVVARASGNLGATRGLPGCGPAAGVPAFLPGFGDQAGLRLCHPASFPCLAPITQTPTTSSLAAGLWRGAAPESLDSRRHSDAGRRSFAKDAATYDSLVKEVSCSILRGRQEP